MMPIDVTDCLIDPAPGARLAAVEITGAEYADAVLAMRIRERPDAPDWTREVSDAALAQAYRSTRGVR